jgi:hypothetical protein
MCRSSDYGQNRILIWKSTLGGGATVPLVPAWRRRAGRCVCRAASTKEQCRRRRRRHREEKRERKRSRESTLRARSEL